jgi:hypothetical protein
MGQKHALPRCNTNGRFASMSGHMFVIDTKPFCAKRETDFALFLALAGGYGLAALGSP